MGLYQGQQQMDAQRDLLGQAPAIATKLGLPESVVRDMIIQGKGPDLVSKMEPTDQQRNIAAEHDAFIKGGGSEDDWTKNYLPMIITGGIPGMTPDMKSMNVARTQWLADPANQGRPTPGYLTDATKWGHLQQRTSDDAKGSFNGMNQGLGEFVDDLGGRREQSRTRRASPGRAGQAPSRRAGKRDPRNGRLQRCSTR